MSNLNLKQNANTKSTASITHLSVPVYSKNVRVRAINLA